MDLIDKDHELGSTTQGFNSSKISLVNRSIYDLLRVHKRWNIIHETRVWSMCTVGAITQFVPC